MKAQNPIWTLKKICPVCEQGESLVLVACPHCETVSVVCDEEGTGYFNTSEITTDASVDPSKAVCIKCGGVVLADFQVASSLQIEKAGLKQCDYE